MNTKNTKRKTKVVKAWGGFIDGKLFCVLFVTKRRALEVYKDVRRVEVCRVEIRGVKK